MTTQADEAHEALYMDIIKDMASKEPVVRLTAKAIRDITLPAIEGFLDKLSDEESEDMQRLTVAITNAAVAVHMAAFAKFGDSLDRQVSSTCVLFSTEIALRRWAEIGQEPHQQGEPILTTETS